MQAPYLKTVPPESKPDHHRPGYRTHGLLMRRHGPVVRADAQDVMLRIEHVNGLPYTPEVEDWVHGGTPEQCKRKRDEAEAERLTTARKGDAKNGGVPGLRRKRVRVRTAESGR